MAISHEPSSGRLGDATQIIVERGAASAFLRFADLTTALNASQQILAARVEFTILQRQFAARPATLVLSPIEDRLGLGRFAEGSVTWHRRAGTEPWLIPGATIDAFHSGSGTLPASGGSGSWNGAQTFVVDVTAALRNAALTGVMPDFRLDSLDAGRLVLAGKAHANSGQRPRLIVTLAAVAGAANRAPVAVAGADIRIWPGQRVYVDGSASFDPDGDRLRYEWEDPTGMLAVSATRWHMPSLSPTVPGRYRLILHVEDHYLRSSDELWVEVVNPGIQNGPPVVNAGPDRFVYEMQRTTVGGSTRDPEGDPLTFSWSLLSGPAPGWSGRTNSQWFSFDTPNISSSGGRRTMIWRLEVSDGTNIAYGYTAVHIDPLPNIAPVARVSPHGVRVLGGKHLGVLNARQSYDPDRFTPATYQWRQIRGPAAALFDANLKIAWFEAPIVSAPSEVEFEFTISDGELSASDRLVFTIEPTATEFSGSPQSLRPYANDLTEREARHLLRRAGFGGDLADAMRVRSLGLGGVIDTWLDPIPTPNLDAELAYLLGGVRTGETFPRPGGFELARYWLEHIIRGPFENMLKERMVFFLNDRYTTSVEATTGARRNHFGLRHFEMLRSDPFPRYPDFLLRLTRDELMLEYLDGFGNVAGTANENYAREFWELFTLGPVDPITGLANYTQHDIEEAARAFTGWRRYDPPEFVGRQELGQFVPAMHDATAKTIFGQTGNYDDAGIINLTLSRPQAAEWLCRNLFVHFVHDHPSPALVREMAAILRANDWRISAVLRAILRSEAMFSAEARRSQVTNPAEFAFQVVKTLGIEADGRRLTRSIDRLDMRLLAPPEVDGFQEGEFWMTEAGLAMRSVLTHEVLAGSHTMRPLNDERLRSLISPLDWASGQELVANALRVLDLEIDNPNAVREVMTYAETRVNRNGTTEPDIFGADVRQVPIKIRGVLLLLMNGLPAFQLD